MNIEQIRQKTAYKENEAPSLKEQTRVWMNHLSNEYPIALTLTIKQTIVEKRPNGTVVRRITKDDCQRIAERFIKKLNREVYGKSAERHSLGLKYVVVLEGDGFAKNYHLHMMVGALPKHIRFNRMDELVRNAKSRVSQIDEQYKVELAYDSGWSEYTSKQVTKTDTDAILWQVS